MVRSSIRRQRGATATEFAISAVVFLAFIVAILELSRALFLWNTSTEITRRYARALSVTDFNNSAALAEARRQATFNSSDGSFALSGSINGSYFRYRYLRGDAQTEVTAMPDCPPQNIINCTADPNGPSCIRFVEVSMCQPGGSGCTNVPYAPILNLDIGFRGALRFPTFTTLVPAAAFGHTPALGDSCP